MKSKAPLVTIEKSVLVPFFLITIRVNVDRRLRIRNEGYEKFNHES